MSNVSKYVFGKNKLGRMKRTVECDETSFDGVQWIPNFKGSQRGAVLKTTNDILLSHGMRKRSQIDSINGEDISNLPFKRIMKKLNEMNNSSQLFSTSFMIPEQDVITVEIFFRGKFCNDYIQFSCDENDNNFIISHINFNDINAQKIIQGSGIKIGYRVIKVKGIKVINKKYNDIYKMIIAASNDTRIDYGILFEQGELDWYIIKTPSSSSSSSVSKHHLKYAKSVSNIGLQKRRKSGNVLSSTKSTRSSLKTKPRSQHVKKTKSYDFAKKDLQKDLQKDLNINYDDIKKHRMSNSNPSNSKTKKSIKSSKRSLNKRGSSSIPNQLQIGKIAFGTSKLGLTRREIQCDSDTFIDVDFVPNFKGSQRGAVLKQTNDKLLSHGFIKRTQIDSINGYDVSSASYHNIINALNEYISNEEIFNIAFNIPAQKVKTVEIFFRGSFMEYIQFISDQNGNNCIIKTIKTNTDIGNILINKCRLSAGYRITKIKTTNVVSKKFDDIKKYLVQSASDMRVQYLVVFEQGKLGWYGYKEQQENDIEQQQQQEVEQEQEEHVLPLTQPVQQKYNHSTASIDSTGITVTDIDKNITRVYTPKDTKFDDDDYDIDESGSNQENSFVIHSSDDEHDDIKQPDDDEEEEEIQHTMNENKMKGIDDDDNKDTNDVDGDSDNEPEQRASSVFEQIALTVTEELKQEQAAKLEAEQEAEPEPETEDEPERERNVESKVKVKVERKKQKLKVTENDGGYDIEEEDKKEEKKMETVRSEKKSERKKDKKKDIKKKDIKKKDIKRKNKKPVVIRKRFIAKIKNVCIAAPFDPNQSLLSFQKEILFRIPNHSKLKGEKNLSKRVRFIKLQTPHFPMLIDCDPEDRLCDIATTKDMIVFHTESDDEKEEMIYY